MAASIVLPVLWKDVDASCAQGVIEIGASDLRVRVLDEITIEALTKILNKKLQNMAIAHSPTNRRVAKILFYGDALQGNRTLGALIPEMATVSPRLVATTRRQPRGVSNVTIFVKTGTDASVIVRCTIYASVLDVKRMLAEKGCPPPDQQRLICAGQQLVDDAILNSYGIRDRSKLFLVPGLRGGASLPRKFADVSENSILLPTNFDPTAPDWLVACKGLNIEGRCKNRACCAYKKLVVHQNHFHSFNLLRDNYVRCPMCHSQIVPLTCGFYDCVWKFEGVQSHTRMHIGSPWKEAFGEMYHRFDADETHGSVAWDSLLIVVKPRRLVALVQRADTFGPLTIVHLDNCAICWAVFTGDGDGKPLVAECGHRFHSAREGKQVHERAEIVGSE